MKLSTAAIAATCVAANVGATSAVNEATCSSLNGPYCAGWGLGFPSVPRHARQKLDLSEEEIKANEVEKSWKIQQVLKQYEKQGATSERDARETEDIFEDIKNLLSELDGDNANPMVGAFAFSSENGAFELLDKMNGDELKEFFETALDDVLVVVDADMSSDATDGLRTTARQLKALENYETYAFQMLDESQRASIRSKFVKHRLVELQQAFEQLVVATDAHDRQRALETAICLFQVAQEDVTQP